MAVAQHQDSDDTDVDNLDRRALEQYLTVLEDQGRVRGCPDLYLVVSESGCEYLVNAKPWACECADHQFRDRLCKHIRRVSFAIGERPVPAEYGPTDVANDLGVHVDGEPRWSR